MENACSQHSYRQETLAWGSPAAPGRNPRLTAPCSSERERPVPKCPSAAGSGPFPLPPAPWLILAAPCGWCWIIPTTSTSSPWALCTAQPASPHFFPPCWPGPSVSPSILRGILKPHGRRERWGRWRQCSPRLCPCGSSAQRSPAGSKFWSCPREAGVCLLGLTNADCSITRVFTLHPAVPVPQTFCCPFFSSSGQEPT